MGFCFAVTIDAVIEHVFSVIFLNAFESLMSSCIFLSTIAEFISGPLIMEIIAFSKVGVLDVREILFFFCLKFAQFEWEI